MRMYEILSEANSFNRIQNNERVLKQLAIAYRHDSTADYDAYTNGPYTDIKDIAKFICDRLDNALSNTKYGNISADNKLDNYAMQLYINGQLEFEDLLGELPDVLGAWKTLARFGKLKNEHKDINQIKNYEKLKDLMTNTEYYTFLKEIENQEELEKQKRNSKFVTLINDENYLVFVPLNYAACYLFNNSMGVKATYCTGSSRGHEYFPIYAAKSMIICILDKNNSNEIYGKYQICAGTVEIKNATQISSFSNSEDTFIKLFGNLGSRIISAINDKASELKNNGLYAYDAAVEINKLKTKFPNVMNATIKYTDYSSWKKAVDDINAKFLDDCSTFTNSGLAEGNNMTEVSFEYLENVPNLIRDKIENFGEIIYAEFIKAPDHSHGSGWINYNALDTATKYFKQILEVVNTLSDDEKVAMINSMPLQENWKKYAALGMLGLGGALHTVDHKYSQDTLTAPYVEKIKKTFSPITKNPKFEKAVHSIAKEAGIVGKELAQFMAQVKHESFNFSKMFEKTNGKKYDKKYNPSIASALGNDKPGDGLRYKGRGIIQLTGKDNYKRAGQALGLPLLQNPDLAADPEISIKIAVWYWNTRVKPYVQDFEDTPSVTKRINSSLRGIEDRQNNFEAYSEMIADK